MTLNQVRFALSSVCLAICCTAPVLAGEPSTPVTAVVLPDGKYSKSAVREMGREAAHILKQSGVSLRWRVGIPSQSVGGLLVVVKLVGRCDMDGSPAFLVPGPLGWAHKVDGTILPFSDLDCDNLRGAVQAVAVGQNQVQGNTLLGRAMGRVLAHELYHIVADTADHGDDGVTQAAFTPRELTSGLLELRPSDARAIENRLNRLR